MARKFVQIQFSLTSLTDYNYVEITLMDTDLAVLDRKIVWRKSLWSSVVIKNYIGKHSNVCLQFPIWI